MAAEALGLSDPFRLFRRGRRAEFRRFDIAREPPLPQLAIP
jgi:hypothetical protein